MHFSACGVHGARVHPEKIIAQDGNNNDDRLAHLDTIDAGKDVDGVRAKYGKAGHVYIVQEPYLSKREKRGESP